MKKIYCYYDSKHSLSLLPTPFKDRVEIRYEVAGWGWEASKRVSLKIIDISGRTAGCVGIAKEALDLSLKYAMERVQFGKSIIKFQTIGDMLAEMTADASTMEAITYRAAWMCDQKLPFVRESAIAKLYTSEVLDRVVDKALLQNNNLCILFL